LWAIIGHRGGRFGVTWVKKGVGAMGGSGGRQSTEEVRAQRLGIRLVDLPDLGRPWIVRDVADALGARPEWLRSAGRALGAARAEEERQRKARFDAVLARRCGFEYPPVTDAASDFAREFANANLLMLLRDALDASAADTYVIDSGFDVSTHARRADETNRERVKRGAALSGRDDESFAEYGLDRAAGTLGDLFDAPTGNTQATYVSGAGFAAERWADAWHDCWAFEGFAHAHVIADLVLRGDIETLEVIAGVQLSDVGVGGRRPFGGVADDVLSLACEALHAWTEIDCPVLDPDEVVEMDAPISALPWMLLEARQSWNRIELLAAAIAGLEISSVGEDLVDG
jgi:hypothetical protein